MQLGHPVHRLPEPGRVDVIRLVPGRVEGAVPQPVVGREIDDLAAAVAEDRNRALRFHVGQGEENEISLVAQAGGVEIAEDEGGQPPKVGKDLVEPLAGQALRDHDGQLQLRVNAKQTESLRSHVSARPRHRDAQHGAYRLEYWNLERAPG